MPNGRRGAGPADFHRSVWCIREILAWADPVAAKAGFARLVLACEPTGHWWKPLVVTAVRRRFRSCAWSPHRSDFGDAAIIARLTA